METKRFAGRLAAMFPHDSVTVCSDPILMMRREKGMTVDFISILVVIVQTVGN